MSFPTVAVSVALRFSLWGTLNPKPLFVLRVYRCGEGAAGSGCGRDRLGKLTPGPGEWLIQPMWSVLDVGGIYCTGFARTRVCEADEQTSAWFHPVCPSRNDFR